MMIGTEELLRTALPLLFALLLLLGVVTILWYKSKKATIKN